MITNTQGAVGSWQQLHVKCRASAVPGMLQAFPRWVLTVTALLPSFVDETSELQEGRQRCLISQPGSETCFLSISPCPVIPLLGARAPSWVCRLTSRRWSKRKLARADLARAPRPMLKTVFYHLSTPLANFEGILCTMHPRGIPDNDLNACVTKQDALFVLCGGRKPSQAVLKAFQKQEVGG